MIDLRGTAASLTSALILLALAAGVGPAVAQAGQFPVAMCHSFLSAKHEFRADANSEEFKRSASCGDGSGLKLDFVGKRSASNRWARWRTAAVKAGLAVVSWTMAAQIKESKGIVGRICLDRAGGSSACTGADTKAEYRTLGGSAPDGSAVSIRLMCAWSRGCPDSPRAHLWARDVMLTVADRTQPTVEVGGALLDPGPKAGEGFLRVSGADGQSGIREFTVEVNGDRVATERTACDSVGAGAAVFRSLSPCPGSAEDVIALDTERAPFRNGINEVRVCAADAYSPSYAEPNTACTTRKVQVDNSCPASPVSGTVFEAGFLGWTGSGVLEHGIAPIVAGRLTDPSGAAATGAIVCMAERRLLPGSEFKPLGQAHADGDGRFSMRLQPGPSRELRLVHRYGSEVRVRELTVNVRARPSLAASSASVRTRGCVRLGGTAPGPANDGLLVSLRGRVKGSSAWTTFAAVETDASGRYSQPYCFRSTSRTTTYEFQAKLHEDRLYPYLTGESPVRTVRVRVPKRRR